MLREACERVGAQYRGVPLAEDPHIAPWREAYRAFGAPKGVRSSIESLLRRVRKGKPIPSINPLVDIYNAVSLEYRLPCGGEDLDALQGSLELARARGDEPFVPLGEKENDPPAPGEVIYRDEAGAVCRCWNWREAERTRLTPETTDAVLVAESPGGGTELPETLAELERRVVSLLGGTTASRVLTRDEPHWDCDR